MRVWRSLLALITSSLVLAGPLHAAAGGHFEDKVADVLVWVVLVLAPIIAIGVFLVVHIIPEKIAERKGHPQLEAIKMICLLSLVFGGILWPLAWIWATTKPTLYKMAYGTDKVEHEGHEPAAPADAAGPKA
jgi:CBS domain containing-hemolysin-like protein